VKALIYPHSQIWTPQTIADIHSRAQGQYRLSGFRPLRDLPTFDELVFLASGLTRFPLEGYKEKCKTETTLGFRTASTPLVLETPIYVGASSALENRARLELARGSSLANSAISLEGKVNRDERKLAHRMIYEVPVRKGASRLVSSLKAEAIQLNLELGTTVDALHGLIRDLRRGGAVKVPIFVSCPGARVEDEVKAAVGVGADGLVLQGLKTSTITRPEDLFDYCRVPIIAGIPRAREALRERRVLGEVSLISATGTRNGADAAKALALGADAVRIDEAALIALGYYNSSNEIAEEGRPNRKIEPGTGIRVAKFINSMTMEIALLARSLGKGDVHSLEYEDLSALTLEASLMSGVRLAGE